MNKFNRYSRIFFAADGDSGGAAVIETISAPGVDVPVIEPAQGTPDIQDVDIPESGIKGPEELWGEKPDDLIDKADTDMGKKPRERGPDGKFLPKDGKPPVATPKPKAVKPEAPKPIAEPEPTAPAKLKLGDEEKTPDEWLAEMKKLREQAAKPADPKPEPVEDKAKTEQERKEYQTRREEFISRKAKSYAEAYVPDQQRLDIVLSGGPGAAKAWGEEISQTVARAIADTREEMSDAFNRVLKERDAELQPIFDQHRSVQQFTEENGILASNAVLKAHPEGLATYRRIKDEYQQAYEGIQQKVNAGHPVSDQEKAWALLYGSQKPEDIRATIVERAAAEVGKIPLNTNGNGAPKAAEVKPPLRVVKPFSSDRPGGPSPGGKAKSTDSRMIDDLAASGHWDAGN